MRTSLTFFVALAASYLAGAVSISLHPLPEARAQASTVSPWVLGVAGAGSAIEAWRLNTVTGYLEMCTGKPDGPRCVAMPGPNPR